MAFQGYESWVKDGTSEVRQTINDNGVWQLVGDRSILSYEACNVFVKRPPTGGDPAGATLQMGLRHGGSGVTPSPVADATLVIPVLATAQAEAVLPERIIPQGRVCVTVSGYTNPFELVVAQ